MLLINFGKALDAQTLARIATDLGEMPEVVDAPFAPDPRPAAVQVASVVERLALDPRQNYVVVLPENAVLAALLVAAIRHAHGHYPWVVTRNGEGAVEILALSALYPTRDERGNV